MPFFRDVAIGCYVRVGIGAHEGRMTYRVSPDGFADMYIVHSVCCMSGIACTCTVYTCTCTCVPHRKCSVMLALNLGQRSCSELGKCVTHRPKI